MKKSVKTQLRKKKNQTLPELTFEEYAEEEMKKINEEEKKAPEAEFIIPKKTILTPQGEVEQEVQLSDPEDEEMDADSDRGERDRRYQERISDGNRVNEESVRLLSQSTMVNRILKFWGHPRYESYKTFKLEDLRKILDGHQNHYDFTGGISLDSGELYSGYSFWYEVLKRIRESIKEINFNPAMKFALMGYFCHLFQ